MQRNYAKRFMLVGATLLGASLCTQALAERYESAVFTDGVMHIPEVLIVDALMPHMVANAELHLNAEGNFDVAASESTPMARVQSISTNVEVTRGDFAIIHLNVLKSWECVQLNPVQVVQQGRAFYLAVTEQPVPDNVRCLPGGAPVLSQVAIDTLPLQPGEYQVYAHGRHIAFTVFAP